MKSFRASAFPLLLLFLLAAGPASCGRPDVLTCYTPGGRCSDAIASEIGAAKSEVLVQAYALTLKPVMDALVQARERGVTVTVILDRSYPFSQNSAFYLSAIRGVPTFIDARHAVADNNLMIIDKRTVITGSMAFTQESEEKNAENMVIIRSESVAGSYLANWYAHKDHAEEFVKIAEPQKREQPPLQPKGGKKKSSQGKKKKKTS